MPTSNRLRTMAARIGRGCLVALFIFYVAIAAVVLTVLDLSVGYAFLFTAISVGFAFIVTLDERAHLKEQDRRLDEILQILRNEPAEVEGAVEDEEPLSYAVRYDMDRYRLSRIHRSTCDHVRPPGYTTATTKWDSERYPNLEAAERAMRARGHTPHRCGTCRP